MKDDHEEDLKDPSKVVSSYITQGIRYRVVTKRWGILLLSCLILSLDIFCFYFFSFINDMTSFYFNVVPAMTDLFASFNMIGRTVGAVIICVFADWMKLREITMYGSALDCVAILMITVGVYVHNFALTLFGMFLNGVLSGILLPIVQFITVTWFPPHERGKSVAAPWTVRRLTLVISNTVATRSLDVTKVGEIGNFSETATLNNSSQHFMQEFQGKFTAVFGSVAIMTLVCCVISVLCVTDTPPVIEDVHIAPRDTNECTPILQSEDGDIASEFSSPIKQNRFNLKSLLAQVKDILLIFKDGSLVIFLCTYTFVCVDYPLTTMLTSSLVIQEFPQTTDQVVGIAFCIGVVAGSVGSAVAGQILDKFNKPQMTFICFALLVAAFIAGFSFSFYIDNFVSVITFYVMMWTVVDQLSLCMLHRLADMSLDRTHAVGVKTFSIAVTAASVAVAISAIIMRVILNHSSPAVAVLYPMPFVVFSIISYIVFWDHFRGPLTREN